MAAKTEPISNDDISFILFNQGVEQAKMKADIAQLKKLVLLAIVTNLPKLLEIFS